MDRRHFNSLMHIYNTRWASYITRIDLNGNSGPDLIDNDERGRFAEVKFTLIHPEEYKHLSWRVLGHQKKYSSRPRKYWLLGTFLMEQRVESMDPSIFGDIRATERLCLSRRMVLVPWSWMDQFPVYHEKGVSKKTGKEYDNYIIFPKASLLPRVTAGFRVRKGRLYICEEVERGDFNIRGTDLNLQNPSSLVTSSLLIDY